MRKQPRMSRVSLGIRARAMKWEFKRRRPALMRAKSVESARRRRHVSHSRIVRLQAAAGKSRLALKTPRHRPRALAKRCNRVCGGRRVVTGAHSVLERATYNVRRSQSVRAMDGRGGNARERGTLTRPEWDVPRRGTRMRASLRRRRERVSSRDGEGRVRHGQTVDWHVRERRGWLEGPRRGRGARVARRGAGRPGGGKALGELV